MFLLIAVPGFCQEEDLPEMIRSIAEELASDESDPEAAALFIEQLNILSEDPININSCEEADLSSLFFLNDFQIKAIIDNVRTTGKIVSFYEISNIPGFDRQITEMMIPFITLGNNGSQTSGSPKLRNTLLTNFMIKPGENDTSNRGSQLKILGRYKVIAGKLTGGFTTEKDPGEPLLSGSTPMPDFLSGYLMYRGKNYMKKIIIGDYSSRFGLGTNINTGIRTGFSVNAPGYMAGRNEIRPYTSADENNFFRGIAAEFIIKNFGITLFLSHQNIDATVKASEDSTYYYSENLYRTGLHNTLSSLQKKDALSETTYGINLSCNLKKLRVGLLWSENRFSLPSNVEDDNPEYLHKFEGKTNRIFSAYYNSTIDRFLLFGEISSNNLQEIALVQGLTVRPSDRLSINLIYRNYSPGFSSFHGSAPGRSSAVNNEKGILGNFTFEGAKHLFFSAGCDISYSPWLKYRCISPSLAKKQEIRVKYIPEENLIFDLSYAVSRNQYNASDGQGIAGMETTSARTFKGQVRFTPWEYMTLTTRADFKVVDTSGSRGMLLLQDMIYRFSKIPVTLWLRYCIFKTDDWDSRLYTYENDLLYSFSVPTMSDEGTRSYFMVKWEIGEIAELRFKYGLTSTVSAGNTHSDKDEVKLQFRIWF